jgi:hypothetical protein
MATPILGSLIFQDDAQIQLGADADLLLYHKDGSGFMVNTVGDLYIQNRADDKDVIITSDDGSGGHTPYITLDGSLGKLLLTSPEYTVISCGTDTDGSDYVGIEQASEWVLKTYNSGSSDVGVSLYHFGNEKLKTVSGGVEITGTITATTFTGNFTGTATEATHVYVADNESTNEENAITFVEGASKNSSGQVGLESDGDLTYNPSSGTVTATAFAGNLTGTTATVTTADVTGELNFQKSGFTAISISTNTHTIDFSQQTNNYSISAQNGNNVLAFSNLGAAVVGKSGSIVITNPASVGSLAFGAIPATAFTPGGGTIVFNTLANKIALINYFIIASDKVLINYVGNFGSYPQP